VQVTGRAGGSLDACVAMARDTTAILAAAAETYLHNAGAETRVEQHVTGSDDTRYVITFHRRPDGSNPDEVVTTRKPPSTGSPPRSCTSPTGSTPAATTPASSASAEHSTTSAPAYEAWCTPPRDHRSAGRARKTRPADRPDRRR
jgi:hypothetical protein